MILIDSSAILAAAALDDGHHTAAVSALLRLTEEGEEVLIHSYLLSEATALLQRRLGLDSALRFLEQAREFRVHWVSADDHAAAVSLLQERRRRGLSLTDCMSFVLMRRYGVTQAIAFDRDFEAEGFALYPPSR